MRRSLSKAFSVAALVPLLFVGAQLASAQTTGTGVTATTTAGAPNTGAGAEAPLNALLLVGSLSLFAVGGVALARSKGA